MFPYIREYGNVSLRKYIFNDEVIIFNESNCKELHRRHIGIINNELTDPQNADALCSASTKLYKTKIIKENNLSFIDLKIIGTYNDGLFNLNYYGYIKQSCLYQ